MNLNNKQLTKGLHALKNLIETTLKAQNKINEVYNKSFNDLESLVIKLKDIVMRHEEQIDELERKRGKEIKKFKHN